MALTCGDALLWTFPDPLEPVFRTGAARPPFSGASRGRMPKAVNSLYPDSARHRDREKRELGP